MSRRDPNPPLWSLSDDDLDRREALYLRLLHGQPVESPITQALHAKLLAVRVEQFTRP